jgi:hypothetical protein
LAVLFFVIVKRKGFIRDLPDWRRGSFGLFFWLVWPEDPKEFFLDFCGIGVDCVYARLAPVTMKLKSEFFLGFVFCARHFACARTDRGRSSVKLRAFGECLGTKRR